LKKSLKMSDVWQFNKCTIYRTECLKGLTVDVQEIYTSKQFLSQNTNLSMHFACTFVKQLSKITKKNICEETIRFDAGKVHVVVR
jgi:hypothetical protein